MNFYNQHLINLIKKAIKEMDQGFFFKADYHKQALNVIKVLEIEGYRLVPLKPDNGRINNGAKAVKLGTTDPNKLVTDIYISMVDY